MSASVISKATISDVVAQTRMVALDEIACEAWRKFPAKDAGAARRDHIIGKLRLELTWTLIEQCQPNVLTQAIGWLLNRTKGMAKQNTSMKLVDGGGLHGTDTQAGGAPANSSQNTGKTVGGDWDGHDAQRNRVPTKSSAAEAKAAKLKILSDKHKEAGAIRAKTVLTLSRLDTVMVFGKAIGKCTVAEVKTWIEARQTERREAGRDIRFASVLIANLPSNAVIGDYWKSGKEVDAKYAEAEAEHAA